MKEEVAAWQSRCLAYDGPRLSCASCSHVSVIRAWVYRPLAVVQDASCELTNAEIRDCLDNTESIVVKRPNLLAQARKLHRQFMHPALTMTLDQRYRGMAQEPCTCRDRRVGLTARADGVCGRGRVVCGAARRAPCALGVCVFDHWPPCRCALLQL